MSKLVWEENESRFSDRIGEWMSEGLVNVERRKGVSEKLVKWATE